MSDTARPTDDATASSEESTTHPESAGETTPPETVYVEQAASGVQLSRIFSLLAMVGVIFALGGLLATYNYLEDRLHSVEISANAAQSILDTKVSAVSGELKKELANSRGSGAKVVVIGGELTRTLYLMNALADDTTLPTDVRAKARAAYDQTSALLVDLQKLQ